MLVFGDVVNDGKQQRFSVRFQWRRIHLDAANLAAAQAMGKLEVFAFLKRSTNQLGIDLRLRQDVDLLDVHELELFGGVAVEAAGGAVGIDDPAARRFDQ